MNVAVIQWKVVKLELTCLGSTLSSGEQEGYKNIVSDDTIRIDYAFHTFLREISEALPEKNVPVSSAIWFWTWSP